MDWTKKPHGTDGLLEIEANANLAQLEQPPE